MRVLGSFCFSLFFDVAGEARRMLRDALTYPARRNERRPSLLFDRGERQRLWYILRHSDRQRYAATLVIIICFFLSFFFFFVLNNENEQARARVAFRSGTSHPVNVSSIKDFQGIHIKGARQASQEGPVLYCDCIQWRVWCCFFLLLLVVYWD